MQPSCDEHGPLPPGWVTAVSRSTGSRYWFNTKTGESRYTRPVPPADLTFHYSPPVSPPHGAPAAAAVPPAPYGAYPQQQQQQHYPPAPHYPPVQQQHGYAPPQAPAPPAGGYGGYGGGGYPPHPAAAYPPAAPPPGYPAVPPHGPGGGPPAPSDAAVALAVASAYDHLEDRGAAGRRASAILHLKNFNNWVKAVLIAEHAPRPCARVLDLACGKLGDLQKWRLAGAREYCGVDISRTAVDDARGRFNDAPARGGRGGGGAGPLLARLARADLGVTNLVGCGLLEPGERFDAVSIQFALHYLFQSEARALAFFRNIAGALAPGGVFVGTIPDAAYLVRRVREGLAARAREGGGGGADGGAPEDTPLTFGNAIYSVTFPPESLRRQAALGGNPYGVRYTFYLAEAVERIDEYLVPWELLERLAAAAGLVPLAKDGFHDFYRRMIAHPRHRATARNMRVLDCEGTMSPDEWEAAGVYRVFAFRRPGPGEPPPPPPPAPLPPWEALLPPGAPGAVGGPPPPAAVPYKAFIDPADVRDTIAG